MLEEIELWVLEHTELVGYGILGLAALVGLWWGWKCFRNRKQKALEEQTTVELPQWREVIPEGREFVTWSEDRERVINGDLPLEEFVEKWTGRVPRIDRKTDYTIPLVNGNWVSMAEVLSNPDPWVYKNVVQVPTESLIASAIKSGQWVRHQRLPTKPLMFVRSVKGDMAQLSNHQGPWGYACVDHLKLAVPKDGEWWEWKNCAKHGKACRPSNYWSPSWFYGDSLGCDCLVPVNFGKGEFAPLMM